MAEERKQLRIAFVCLGDPENVLTWSGTPRHMLHALRRQFEVTLVIRKPWPVWSELVRHGIRRLSRGAVDLRWWPAWSRRAAAPVIAKILEANCDLVFAVAVTPLCAELVKECPTIFVSDATLGRMRNYNPRFAALLPALKREAAALESICIQHAVCSFFPSTWASNSAVMDHGGAPTRIVQIPWGANMQATQIAAPETRSPTKWRLLFVGTHWHGKGGDIALEAVADIRRRGHDVHLDIVGSSPPDKPVIEGVTFHGFLDKREPRDARKIETLFMTAHAFLLPTRFEALGIVFAEAASFAVPSVSYATGGVPAMVENGVTGVLLPEQSPAAAFADALVDLLSNRARYLEMCHAALEASREQLNWVAWAARVRQEVEARLTGSQATAGTEEIERAPFHADASH